jgi:hypothetical protein
LYDLADRYSKELVKMKLSKVQRQVRYEEQQRKLMKELMAESDPFNYEDIMMMQKITTQGSEDEGNDPEDEDDAGLLSEWRKYTHDRKYAINRSFKERHSSKRQQNLYETFENSQDVVKSERVRNPIRSNQAS